jgi:MoaA/NifB/PqqE/SkfB family radical SAM enzyme
MNVLESQRIASTVIKNHKPGTIWLELTNGCNLHCGHCYSDSFPGSQSRDKLSHQDYLRLIDEAANLGISTVQFIGGEPLLYKRLPELVEQAQSAGFRQIEIFSNLVASRFDVFDVVNPAKVSFATSVYSFEPSVHDAIVNELGSFLKTVKNITRLVERGVRVRTSFIEMDQNRGQYEQTTDFLRALGVAAVTHDEVREFGRGGSGHEPSMSSLCGNCAGNTLCVTSEGKALPCIMSRAWPLGDVSTHSLQELMNLEATINIRAQIARCTPQTTRDPCGPNGTCGPTGYQTPCGPNGVCGPTGRGQRSEGNLVSL